MKGHLVKLVRHQCERRQVGAVEYTLAQAVVEFGSDDIGGTGADRLPHDGDIRPVAAKAFSLQLGECLVGLAAKQAIVRQVPHEDQPRFDLVQFLLDGLGRFVQGAGKRHQLRRVEMGHRQGVGEAHERRFAVLGSLQGGKGECAGADQRQRLLLFPERSVIENLDLNLIAGHFLDFGSKKFVHIGDRIFAR